MKLILLQDVKGIGKKDQTVEVKDGYAQNFLIPRGLAVKSTVDNIKNLEKQKEQKAAHEEELKEAAIVLKGQIEAITLEFSAKVGKSGTMIGTISLKQVEQEFLNKYSIQIDKRKITDKCIINAFGISRLKIELYKGVFAEIKVHVSEEK